MSSLQNDNRKLRKAGTEPNVSAYLTLHPDGNGAINFVLINVGQGAARNISFNLDYDTVDFENHKVMLRNEVMRAPMSLLPSGEKISALFGIGHELAGSCADKKFLNPFTINITYEDIYGKRYTNRQILDVSQFRSLSGIFAKPAINEIAESLKKVESHLRSVVNRASYSVKIADKTSIEDTHRNHVPTSKANNESELV